MRGLAQPVIRTKRELNDLFGMGGTRYFRWSDIEGWRNGIRDGAATRSGRISH
tara:strand:+ start:220 stop:378 length:159 start_codon:yes stop_codon:yes gene_type:complete